MEPLERERVSFDATTHSDSADESSQQPRRQSVASLGSCGAARVQRTHGCKVSHALTWARAFARPGDDTPRDRLINLLTDLCDGKPVEMDTAREVRAAAGRVKPSFRLGPGKQGTTPQRPHADHLCAPQVRDAVLNNTLFVPNALLQSLQQGGDASSGDNKSLLLRDPFLRDTLASLLADGGVPGSSHPPGGPPSARLNRELPGRPGGRSLGLGRSDSTRLRRSALDARNSSSSTVNSLRTSREVPSGGQPAEAEDAEEEDEGGVPGTAASQVAARRQALVPSQQEALGAMPLAVQAAAMCVGVTAAPEVHALCRLLEAVPCYDFDAFALYDASGGAPVTALFVLLLVKLGLVDTFHIDLGICARFTHALETRMPRNGYHNAEHIADVLQSMAILLTGGLQDVANLTEDPLCVLALLLAASVHDFEHPGLTADHLVAVAHPWALLYNDRAVLEQHHLAEAFSLLRHPGMDWTRQLEGGQQQRLRKLVIQLVMATDMKEHFTLLGAFGTLLHKTRHATLLRRRLRASVSAAGGDGQQQAQQQQHCGGLSDSETVLVLQMALKVADLGHLRAPLDIHRRWVAGLCSEFYAQGDLERARGMPVNELMSRERAAEMPAALAESQVAFFEYLVLPLVQQWARATGAKRWLERVRRNYDFWCTQRCSQLDGSESAFVQFVQSHREPAQRIAGLPTQLSIPEEVAAEVDSLKVEPHNSNSRVGSQRGSRHGGNSAEGMAAHEVHTLIEQVTLAAAAAVAEPTSPASEDGDSGGSLSDGSGDTLGEENDSGELWAEPGGPSPFRSSARKASVRVCDWCAMPSHVHGVKRLPRPVRAAAAAAAASAAVQVLAGMSTSRSSAALRDTSPPPVNAATRRLARFSESDAALGPRGCHMRFEDFRNVRGKSHVVDSTQIYSRSRQRKAAATGGASTPDDSFDAGAGYPPLSAAGPRRAARLSEPGAHGQRVHPAEPEKDDDQFMPLTSLAAIMADTAAEDARGGAMAGHTGVGDTSNSGTLFDGDECFGGLEVARSLPSSGSDFMARAMQARSAAGLR